MRRRRVALVASASVGVVVALLVVVLATRQPATDRIAKSPLVGKPAPAIELKTLKGTSYDLGAYRGQWVLVNFFATWCAACVREHPELIKFAAEHGKLGDASVVSVVYDDDPSIVRKFFAEKGGTWPVVIDPSGSTALEYGMLKVPESFLVSPDGMVRAKVTGGVTASGLDKVMKDLGA